MRILSGIQPSGRLHLGNYFGMIKPMLGYQGSQELFCFIVNYHALTSNQNGPGLRQQTWDAACDLLALGLDPKQSVFWIQSDVPEVTELAWVLSNITGLGLLERCHSYKDKIANGIKPNHGLFSYPILMAADILIMQADRVPVGGDQKQHLEVSRDIAASFNRIYGQTFQIPEPEIHHQGKMIVGTDGRKMSKVYANTIDIFSDEKTLKKKIMGYLTDSTPPDNPKETKDNALFDLYAAFMTESEKQSLMKRFDTPGLKYSDIKKEVFERVWSYFDLFRKQRHRLEQDRGYVVKVLADGAQKARQIAGPTLASVRERIGLDYAKT